MKGINLSCNYSICFYYGDHKNLTTQVDKAIGWLNQKRKVTLLYLSNIGNVEKLERIKAIVPSSVFVSNKYKIVDANNDVIFVYSNSNYAKLAIHPTFLVENHNASFEEASQVKAKEYVQIGGKVRARMVAKDCTTTTSYIKEIGTLKNEDELYPYFITDTNCIYWML